MNEERKITLRQGLDKFYQEHENRINHNNKEIPQEVRTFFQSHDIAHVLFNCDISLYGEGAVKIWTIFGTTLGFWKHIELYHKAHAFELSKNFSFFQEVSNTIKLLFSIPAIVLRANRMSKPWPWGEYETYLDTDLVEIRQEFNITVLS